MKGRRVEAFFTIRAFIVPLGVLILYSITEPVAELLFGSEEWEASSPETTISHSVADSDISYELVEPRSLVFEDLLEKEEGAEEEDLGGFEVALIPCRASAEAGAKRNTCSSRLWMVVWWLSWLAVITGLLSLFSGIELLNLEDKRQLDQHQALMVAAWDRRYYRTSPSGGLEVQLVKKSLGRRATWLVVEPGGTVAHLDIGHRASVATAPKREIT